MAVIEPKPPPPDAGVPVKPAAAPVKKGAPRASSRPAGSGSPSPRTLEVR